MSQASPKPAEPAKGSSTRLIVLLIIFALAIVALLYDYKVARPKTHEGYTIVKALLDKRHEGSYGKDQFGPNEVQEALGRKPASSDSSKGDTLIETYVWRSGLPFRKYYVTVLYRGKDKKLLDNVLENEELTDEHIMETKFVEVDPDKAEPARQPTAMNFGRVTQKKSNDGDDGDESKGKASAGGADDGKKSEGADGEKKDEAKPDGEKKDEVKADGEKKDEAKPVDEKKEEVKPDAPEGKSDP